MQVINLSFAGIYSNTNNLNDQTINGGLLKADNIVIDQPNVAKSRRGQKKYNTYSDPIRDLATYRSTLLVFTDNSLLVDDGSGNYTVLSSSIESPLDCKKFHYVESNKNFYFCDKSGVLKLDSLSSTPLLAGCPQALAITSLTSSNGSAISSKSQVAYRIVYGYKDKNSNLILGAPSDRKIFSNGTNNVVNVTGQSPIPEGIDTSYFVQVYRSSEFAYDPNATPPIDVTPDDELQLITESPITASDIANGYITFVDKTPPSMLGAYLYTNETQEGITQSNYQPPLCKDIELYKNSVFYANTKTLSTFTSNLLSADQNLSQPDVLTVGDTITIGNVTFTAVSTTPSSLEFQISSSADPSTAIEETVQSLIESINNSNCDCYAFYSSTDSDIVGQFTIQARSLDDDNISVVSSRPDAFYPALTGTKTVSEEHKNRVYFSKPQQPEAVPVLNYIDVGSANYEIKRIIALRDSLFILKSDGIYRISGESASSFTCKLFDGTTKIIASETAVAFNNMVYAVADQGIITISETGVSIISMPIENDLFELSEYANFSTLSFGVAYGSDRKYILFVPTSPVDTTCTQAYIYNSYTNTFVRWDLTRSCGIVRPSETKQGELFLGTSDGITYKERKEFSLEDYCDDEYEVSIVDSGSYYVVLDSIPSEIKVGFTIRQDRLSSIVESIDTDTNTIRLSNDSLYDPYNAIVEGSEDYPINILASEPYEVTLYSIPDGIQVGDTVKQGSLSSTISSIDVVNKKLTLSDDTIFEIPNAIFYTPIKKTIEWFPLTCNNPSFYKHFREITFMFLEARFKNLSFTVYSDTSPDSEETKIEATSLGAWGYGGWGLLPWGGEVGGRQAIRSYIPLEKSRCRWLDLALTSNQAFTQFEVSGISLMYSLASERDTR